MMRHKRITSVIAKTFAVFEAALVLMCGSAVAEPCKAYPPGVLSNETQDGIEQIVIVGKRASIPQCTRDNTSSAEIGFVCVTSKGGRFEKVEGGKMGEAWEGPDHLIWGSFVGKAEGSGPMKNGRVLRSPAMDLCAAQGAKLPTEDDFMRAERAGFREVLQDMRDHFYVSTSTSVEGDGHEYVGIFSGTMGYFGYPKGLSQESVRCVRSAQ